MVVGRAEAGTDAVGKAIRLRWRNMEEEDSAADSETEHGQGEDAEHEPGERAEHLAHYAHELHLLLEEVERVEHDLHHLGGYAKEIEAAQKLAKTHAQMAFDVRGMRKGVAVIERAARQAGKVGPKAAAQLTKARSALTAAQKAFSRTLTDGNVPEP